jgi:hypothetical protein
MKLNWPDQPVQLHDLNTGLVCPGKAAYGMRVMSYRGGLLAGLAIMGLTLAGCSGDPEEPDDFPLDTMPAPDSPEPDPTGTASTDAPSATQELPQECSAIIAYVDVLDAVAVPLSGGVSPIFVDGGFHEASGRLQRLTCSYHADPSATGDDEDGEEPEPPPVLEIAVSSYVDAESAEARVADTIGGAGQVEPLEVAGSAGYVLSSEESVTFVAADGELTYVASLTRGIVPENAEQVVLITLAEHLLGGDG